MKTPLTQIDSMVVDELLSQYATAHVLVPLPQDIYNQLWAVIRPEDRYSQVPELYEMLPSHLCAGKESPVYVAHGYTAGVSDPIRWRLPINVVSPAIQERIHALLVTYLQQHPWLAMAQEAGESWWARMRQRVWL